MADNRLAIQISYDGEYVCGAPLAPRHAPAPRTQRAAACDSAVRYAAFATFGADRLNRLPVATYDVRVVDVDRGARIWSTTACLGDWDAPVRVTHTAADRFAAVAEFVADGHARGMVMAHGYGRDRFEAERTLRSAMPTPWPLGTTYVTERSTRPETGTSRSGMRNLAPMGA